MREISFEMPEGGTMEVTMTDLRHEGLRVMQVRKEGEPKPMQMLMSDEDAEALMAMLEAETAESGHA